MDAIAITVAMPITTPSTVRLERSLFARSCSSAIRHPPRTECSFRSFLAERFWGVEPGGAGRWVVAEGDAVRNPDEQPEGDRPAGHARRQRRDGFDQTGERESRQDRKSTRLNSSHIP